MHPTLMVDVKELWQSIDMQNTKEREKKRERERSTLFFTWHTREKFERKRRRPFAGCFEKRCCLVEISKIVVSVQFTLFNLPLKIAFFAYFASL